jgi:hypothetical protein
VLTADYFLIGPAGVEPASAAYKTAALTVKLRASGQESGFRHQESVLDVVRVFLTPDPWLLTPSSMRSEGFEPTPTGLKVRDAAATPRPQLSVGWCFNRSGRSFSRRIVASRPRWSRTTVARISAECSRTVELPA